MPSAKPIAKKLYIRENYKVLLLNEPDNYRDILGELPENVSIMTELSHETEPFDLIHIFVKTMSELKSKLNELKPQIKPKGLMWVSYPKGGSKVETDLNRDIIWEYGKTIGLSAVAQVAIDEMWSAMRLKIVE